MSGTIEILVFERIEDTPIGFLDEMTHRSALRPRFGQRARTAIGIGRIDPAREQPFQPLVDARSAEAFLDERVEAERRQVAVVEHNRMTERDRLAVVRLVGQQIE